MKEEQKNYVDYGKYFVINRGRQYGKTTTLRALAKYLKEDYIIFSLDFQRLGTGDSANEQTFVCAFSELMVQKAMMMDLENGEELIKPLSEFFEQSGNRTMPILFMWLSRMCAKAPKPIVLMIDTLA